MNDDNNVIPFPGRPAPTPTKTAPPRKSRTSFKLSMFSITQVPTTPDRAMFKISADPPFINDAGEVFDYAEIHVDANLSIAYIVALYVDGSDEYCDPLIRMCDFSETGFNEQVIYTLIQSLDYDD